MRVRALLGRTAEAAWAPASLMKYVTTLENSFLNYVNCLFNRKKVYSLLLGEIPFLTCLLVTTKVSDLCDTYSCPHPVPSRFLQSDGGVEALVKIMVNYLELAFLPTNAA